MREPSRKPASSRCRSNPAHAAAGGAAPALRRMILTGLRPGSLRQTFPLGDARRAGLLLAPRMRRLATFALSLAVLAACRGHDARVSTPDVSATAATASPAAVEPAANAAPSSPPMNDDPNTASSPGAARASTTAIATFANGCFWCTEAVLEQIDGVLDVTSGYMGGSVDSPSYQQVCSGTTGHAECVQVTFDPARVSYSTLLEWFFRSHDPTTLNRQGADEGTQYRSAVFVHDDAQAAAARAAIREFQPSFASPIVTEVTPASRFWPAELYHQDYFRTNPSQGYCRMVIAPKLKKLGLRDAR
jgi:peptide-methionine (S)-S-oxide reductase